MSENRTKSTKPAVLFGKKSVKRMGYIDEFIFACEIQGADHIRYSKPRRPKYHLVIIVIKGDINLINSIPSALASTERVCASVSVASTKAGYQK